MTTTAKLIDRLHILLADKSENRVTLAMSYTEAQNLLRMLEFVELMRVETMK